MKFLEKFKNLKTQAFSLFQKQEQKQAWKKFLAFSLIGVFLAFGIYLYILLAPFKEFFWRLPSITGFFGDRNYLVLIQNNSELRPTGGFITAYGEMNFFLGDMDLEFRDSYDIAAPDPQIEPPYPLNELLSKDIFYKGYVFRDANWSPDFPTSAQAIKSIYLEGQDRIDEIDGVIALDFIVFEDLLDLVGPLDLGDKVFTSENVFHLMQFYSKNIDLHSVDDLAKRKNVMKEIAPMIIKKILLSPSKYDNVVALFKKHLDERHVLINFTRPFWQSVLEDKGWAGELKEVSGDFVHINRANIGGRKADRYIQPSYNYTVTFDELGRGSAQLDIEYNYIGTQGLYSDFYQAYVRAYLPRGIENLKSWGDNRSDFVKEEENGLLSSGTLMHIWPGETQSLHYSYDLHPSITPMEYALNILPQAGTFGENWNVVVRGANVDSFWESSDFVVRENTATFSQNIVEPVVLRIAQQLDTTSPVIVWQKFLSNNMIELQFSEKLDEASLLPSNFSLVDKNVNNQEIQDQPVVVSVRQVDDYKVLIKLQGVSWQIEEYFKLTLENIADFSGNAVIPNPKEITLVQR